MTRQRLRLSFRTRLGLIITAVIVAAGAGLLAVQYLVVQQLFASAISITAMTCSVDDAIPTQGRTEPFATGCAVAGTIASTPGEAGDTLITAVQAGPVVLQQSTFLSEEVGRGLLLWSIVMLVVFAALAAAVAFWLARRSLDRIGEVTTAARDISERDLGRRLDLPGPDDEIKELGDTFDGMLDRLQLAFAAQDRFVANASHELRTPLTVTRTALEIPLEHGTVPAALLPNVRRALRATEQSERLISALLSLARGRATLDNVEEVDVAAVLEEELEELAPSAHTRRIEVTVDAAAASTRGDAALLARAVRNLLDNGIRHNREGGALEVSLRAEDGAVVLRVENTGLDIAEGDLALLTEPFYRGDASRTSGSNREGMGLGLAIVKSIAETHGGELRLTARDGGGLVTELVLPG